MQPLWDHIELKATGALSSAAGAAAAGAQDQQKEKNITQPIPFNLTQPKPRLIPEPEKINREIKALELPTSHKDENKKLQKVVEEKQGRLDQHREETKAKYPAHLEFEFQTHKRSGGEAEKDRIKAGVEKERFKECTFQPAYHTNAMQTSAPEEYIGPRANAEVKQTASSVLREDALVKKKQANEYATLKQFEEDLRDASTYYEWQANMRERDDLEKELHVAQRKIEMQLARDEAIIASENLRAKKPHLGRASEGRGETSTRNSGARAASAFTEEAAVSA